MLYAYENNKLGMLSLSHSLFPHWTDAPGFLGLKECTLTLEAMTFTLPVPEKSESERMQPYVGGIGFHVASSMKTLGLKECMRTYVGGIYFHVASTLKTVWFRGLKMV